MLFACVSLTLVPCRGGQICHSRSAQYAIPDWHWAWQFTHGRQVVNPMPLMFERIVRLRGNGSTPTIGVGAYSEGV